MSAAGGTLVETYLRRLDAALGGLPAGRRREISEGIAQHIAEARHQMGQDNDETVRAILGQLGDPEVIAAEALEAERGFAGAELPPSLRYGVWLMYAGGVLSLAAVAADIATSTQLRAVISRTPTARGLVGTATHATLFQAAAVNLLSVVLFVLIARWSGKGSTTARTLAGVLFTLRTVAALIGPGELSVLSPWPVAVRALTVLVWLAGLGAIVALWQRSSTAFIRAQSSR